jgi:hypothetical protein
LTIVNRYFLNYQFLNKGAFMHKIYVSAILASSILVAGCASLATPSSQGMAQVPVVRFGDKAPKDIKFVTLYPAGINLPIVTSVKGSLFDKTDESTLIVTLKKDLYTYENWVSFDGKTWVASNKSITGEVKMTLPGQLDGQNTGTLGAEFNLK